MEEVSKRYGELVTSLSSWKLRSRVVVVPDEDTWPEPPLRVLSRILAYWCRRMSFMLRRIPVIPADIPPRWK